MSVRVTSTRLPRLREVSVHKQGIAHESQNQNLDWRRTHNRCGRARLRDSHRQTRLTPFFNRNRGHCSQFTWSCGSTRQRQRCLLQRHADNRRPIHSCNSGWRLCCRRAEWLALSGLSLLLLLQSFPPIMRSPVKRRSPAESLPELPSKATECDADACE